MNSFKNLQMKKKLESRIDHDLLIYGSEYKSIDRYGNIDIDSRLRSENSNIIDNTLNKKILDFNFTRFDNNFNPKSIKKHFNNDNDNDNDNFSF